MRPHDPAAILNRLCRFRGGVADTSTLIYLEKCSLLEQVCTEYRILVPGEVVREFGRLPSGCRTVGARDTKDADTAVLAQAAARSLPVLSEDGKLLLRCSRQGVEYYNCLMLLHALLVQDALDRAGFDRAYAALRCYARYSPGVWQVGRDVFSLFVR
jgi:hypothetical protein